MSRWEPDGRLRLQAAALALFAERGYAETTAAAIAERAGLTERTFFRHFPDKREVLFAGGNVLGDILVEAVAAAPPGAGTLEVITAGLDAVARQMQPRRADVQQRAPIIAAYPELRERELAKLEAWSAGVAAAFAGRGQPDPEAQLAAGLALTLFRAVFQRWIDGPAETQMTDVVHSVVRDLGALVA
jgi:AcrR family transcriptional regulator